MSGGLDSESGMAKEGSGPWTFLSQPHLDVVVFSVSILSFEVGINPHFPLAPRQYLYVIDLATRARYQKQATLSALPLHLLAAAPHGPRPAQGSLPMDGGVATGSALLVDVLSVKMHPRAVMERLAPPNCDLLCTHPMFGPESGRGTWNDLPFVFEKASFCFHSN